MDADEIPDREIRACLARLMIKQAVRVNPRTFIASVFLTFPAPPRLAVIPISGNIDLHTGVEATSVLDVLDHLASVMSTDSGQVMCRSMLPDGFNGMIVIGSARRMTSGAGSLLPARPHLLGVHVHSDAHGGSTAPRSHLIAYDLSRDLMEDVEPSTDPSLLVLLEAAWEAYNVIESMSAIPLPDDAEALAMRAMEGHPAVTLDGGVIVHEKPCVGSFTGNGGSAPNLLGKVNRRVKRGQTETGIAALITATLRGEQRPPDTGTA